MEKDVAAQTADMYQNEPAYTIRVVKDGPLLVTGDVTLRKATIVHKEKDHYVYQDDGVIDHPDRFILCRCGKSPIQPFCDGKAHKGWDGTEALWDERFQSRAKVYEGNGLVLFDDYDMCCLARFCHTDRGKIWKLMEMDDDESRELAIRAADECPAGRLVMRDAKTGEVLEPKYPNEIIVLEDPGYECSGPLWARGNFRLIAADGHEYEKRSKYTLCRCGESRFKPICDCRHYHVHWDAQTATERTPKRWAEGIVRNVDDEVSMVTDVAKSYLGHGVPFEDLLSAGLDGLRTAQRDLAAGAAQDEPAWYVREAIAKRVGEG